MDRHNCFAIYGSIGSVFCIRKHSLSTAVEVPGSTLIQDREITMFFKGNISYYHCKVPQFWAINVEMEFEMNVSGMTAIGQDNSTLGFETRNHD